MLRIFTEGRDEEFIQIFLKQLGYTKGSDFSTDAAGGWQKIHEIAPKIREYQDAEDVVVLIFDADDAANGGGFAPRETALKKMLEDEELVGVNLFLFPDNASNGDFESLAVSCATSTRQGVFTCFNAYEACVTKLTTATETFKTPLRKSRFFAYFECIDESERSKEKARKTKKYFFDNSKYWDLKSPNLNALRDFLIALI